MNAEKYTQKTLDAVKTAQSMAQENGNQYLTPEHLLYALVDQDGGLIASLFGKMGVFYKVCGHEVDGSDGLIDYDISFKEYVDYGILNPENPSGVCDEIYEKTGVKAMIIDASDIDCVILGKCRNVTLTDEQLCELVRANPAGQEGQCTPFILIRKKA